MLLGKVVQHVLRHRDGEVGIEFDDGSRFFADSDSRLERSITLAK